jgi:hypothetical protein
MRAASRAVRAASAVHWHEACIAGPGTGTTYADHVSSVFKDWQLLRTVTFERGRIFEPGVTDRVTPLLWPADRRAAR